MSEQEIKSLYEEIMTENFYSLVKKKTYKSRKLTEFQAGWTKGPTLRHIIIKMTRFKDKERILKAAREKQVVTYKGTPIRLLFDF